MILRGIEFGPALGASGIEGFFGEGYPYHRYLKLLPGFDFRTMTFVAKTMTLNGLKGNMPLKEDGITPQEFKPECIVVKPFKGVGLNAVGLSGPRAEILFEDGRWQARKDPFFLSYMSIATTVERRIEEAKGIVQLLQKYLDDFQAPIGLQINFSCPNVGLHLDGLIQEVEEILKILSILDIPLMPKFNVLLPIRVAYHISQNPACDAICVSNTIPWGELSLCVNWKALFGSDVSPLAHFGGGGLSGKPLLPLVSDWVRAVRSHHITKPINAGGGILSSHDVDALKNAGASSIFLGSIAMLRPWRVGSVIKRAHKLFV